MWISCGHTIWSPAAACSARDRKRQVESDLLRASLACFKIDDFQNDPRIRDLHYRCYNFQAWHLAAVGLVGLAVRDPGLVDYALHSPYGLRHLVAHDIRDDGLFWERSVGIPPFRRQRVAFTEGDGILRGRPLPDVDPRRADQGRGRALRHRHNRRNEVAPHDVRGRRSTWHSPIWAIPPSATATAAPCAVHGWSWSASIVIAIQSSPGWSNATCPSEVQA